MVEPAIKRLAWWAGIVVLTILSWQAGKVTWLYWPDDNQVVIADGETIVARDNELKNSYQTWHLFGQPRKAQPAVVEVRRDTPKTRLNLQLMGVVVSEIAEDSGAIIAEKGQSADYYKVNDPLPGDSTLAGVYSDHVLLSRNGVLEKLSFDELRTNPSAMTISEQRNPANIQPADIETPEQFLDVAKARLSQNPTAALASVGLAPATASGGPSGYVYDGNNPMLAAMNMQKGDIIRSVNGHVLGDMQEDQTKLQEFYESGTLAVEIERAGAIFTITYPIP